MVLLLVMVVMHGVAFVVILVGRLELDVVLGWLQLDALIVLGLDVQHGVEVCELFHGGVSNGRHTHGGHGGCGREWGHGRDGRHGRALVVGCVDRRCRGKVWGDHDVEWLVVWLVMRELVLLWWADQAPWGRAATMFFAVVLGQGSLAAEAIGRVQAITI